MKNDRLKLQQYIFRIQILMVIALSVLIGACGIYINLKEEASQRDLNLQNVAESIAHSGIVRDAISGGSTSELEEHLDTLKESLSDIDVISVVGKEHIRIYHSNHELIGTVFDGTLPDFTGDQRYYAIDDTGPSGIQRRAYAAIYNNNEVVGYVMAIMLMANIWKKTIRTILIFLGIILLAIFVELLISHRISRKIREKLLGYEPDAFSAMYKIRDNILESLDEGVIAVDNDANIQFINKSASGMLDLLSDDSREQSVKKLFPDSYFSNATEGREVSIPVTSAAGADILMDRIPVNEEGQHTGAVAILHNRTEFTRLAEDLAGTKYLVDSMRANNHDFTNKLHVILGLLQMEMYDKAISYIENITIVQRETISRIMHSIDVPAVAALLIGKISRASELNVHMTFQNDSHYSPEDIRIPDDVLITVIGNLIDNALEALDKAEVTKSADTSSKELFFGMYSTPGALLITCDDNGPGMSEDTAEHIFENGFSTKGPGRGTGLYQVRKLVESCGGTISVQSQPGDGTSFSVSFTGGKNV